MFSNWGGGSGNDRPPTVAGFLRPIDIEQLARSMGVDEKAAARGSSNLPDAGTQTFDATEQQIIEKIQGEWAWQGSELVNQLRAYSQRINAYSIEAECTRLEVKASHAETKLRNADHRAEAELGPLREGFLAARDELQQFRTKHRLQRPARLPAGRWTTVGLLFVIVAIESVLNGLFFAGGSDYGLLGGIGIAIGVSAANVALAFALGLAPARWLHLRNYLVKLAGLIILVVGWGGLFFLHAFAAHLREVPEHVPDGGRTLYAFDTLIRSPWLLTDINSYYLFALGLVFAVGAFWKGYTLDDPYPLYGATTRRLIDARENYSDAHAALFEDLQNIKDETVNALELSIINLPRFPQKTADLRTQRGAMLKQFQAYETAAESATNQLLQRYREKNTAHRSAPAPPHFSERWNLPHSFLNSEDVRTLTTEATSVPADVASILAKLTELSRNLLRGYEDLLGRYPHPTKMP